MNWNQVLTLLMVAEKTREQPKLKALFDSAMDELHGIASAPKAEPVAEQKVEHGRRKIDG